MRTIRTKAKHGPKRGLGFYLQAGIPCFLLPILAFCIPLRPLQREAPAARLPPLSGQFSQSGSLELAERWWHSFEDESLNQLVESGLRENVSLAAVWDRLSQARALARVEGASLYPSLEGDLGAARSVRRGSDAALDGARSTDHFSDFGLGLAASYELDLWGRLRANREAAKFEVWADEADWRAAALSLSATIAAIWYQWVEENGQIELLGRQLETNQSVLDLIDLRFRKGLVGAPDLLRQRQLVEAGRGEVARARARAGVLAHQLAILLGEVPGNWSPPLQNTLIELPALPQTGVPAELVQRRPDIQRALFQARAADQRVAAAIANRFPRLSLSARADSSSEKVADLFRDWLATISANLLGPLFDGGRRKSEVARTRALLSERLNLFEQIVLESLGEVEDALVREKYQREYIASLQQQLALAQQVIDRVRDRYSKGVDDYLRILDALQSHQTLERNLLSARGEWIEIRIQLCRALAGGWEAESGVSGADAHTALDPDGESPTDSGKETRIPAPNISNQQERLP